MSSTAQHKPFKAHHPMPLLCIDNVIYLLNLTVFSPLSLILIPALIYYLYFIHEDHQTLTSQFYSIKSTNDFSLLSKSIQRSFSSRNSYPVPTASELKLLLWSSSSPFRTLKNLFLFSLVKNLNSLLNRLARNHGAWQRDPINWKKDTVIITGGATGIGKALVENLSQVHHAKIAVLDMAQPTYRPAPKGAPEILYFKTDVSNEEQVKEVADKVKAVFGDTAAVLVNCAGIANGDNIMDTDPNSALRLWKVNTWSHWITCRQFLPSFIANNHGHVVSVASGASYACLPSMSQYAVSKAGALAFHEVLSGEFRARYKAPRVRNTIICPLKVTTQLGDGMDAAPNQFFAPTLEPETVAENIAAALNSGLSQHIMMPALANLIPWLRVWPDWMKRGFELVGHTDDTVTEKSKKRAFDNGYGKGESFIEAVKAKTLS